MIIQINATDELIAGKERLKETMAAQDHLLIRGLFSREEVNEVRKAFLNVFRELEPRATTGVRPHEIVDNDLLKFSIGQASGAQSIARLFMILYRNEEKLTAAERSVFEKLVRIWEIFQGKKYTSEELEATGTFFAKRYQYYPVGGGFMGTHADTVAADSSKALGSEYYQFVLPITEKGTDYTEGGGYIVQDGKHISNEDRISLGDLIVYNGAIEHGVDDIDPHEPLRIDGDSGRIVMFITLYKKMS